VAILGVFVFSAKLAFINQPIAVNPVFLQIAVRI